MTISFFKAADKVILGGYNFQVPLTLPPMAKPIKSRLAGHRQLRMVSGRRVRPCTSSPPPTARWVAGRSMPSRMSPWGSANILSATCIRSAGSTPATSATPTCKIADVEQVFQSAIYGLNSPATQAPGSDFFDAMDSCGDVRCGQLAMAPVIIPYVRSTVAQHERLVRRQ